ncbi:MAG: hypothetical protein JG773_357, partial [Spirochaeta sp.]|nr:hypothetical protein [Spirochaeta sp.]
SLADPSYGFLQFVPILYPCLEEYKDEPPDVLVYQSHEDIMVYGIEVSGKVEIHQGMP